MPSHRLPRPRPGAWPIRKASLAPLPSRCSSAAMRANCRSSWSVRLSSSASSSSTVWLPRSRLYISSLCATASQCAWYGGGLSGGGPLVRQAVCLASCLVRQAVVLHRGRRRSHLAVREELAAHGARRARVRGRHHGLSWRRRGERALAAVVRLRVLPGRPRAVALPARGHLVAVVAHPAARHPVGRIVPRAAPLAFLGLEAACLATEEAARRLAMCRLVSERRKAR
eukprot:scaffold10490_cov66-Phaeocystis_antarctica.AAC.5